MSFIIKGIDLPKDFEALAIITKDGKASVLYGPNVIQIPKGHGRLIVDTIIRAGTFGLMLWLLYLLLKKGE